MKCDDTLHRYTEPDSRSVLSESLEKEEEFMKKRIVQTVLLATVLSLLSATLVFATGGAEQAPAAPAAPAAAVSNLPANAQQYPWIFAKNPSAIKGTVRFWMPFKGDQGMNDLIAEFNKYYPNVKVELTTYNNNTDGNVGVNTAIMGGEVDVLASFGLANAYRRWENNLYIPLDERMKAEGIDLVSNWGTDKYRYKNTTFSFPCGGLSYYIVINKTAWDQAGLGAIPTEWTWDEYLEASRKMTKKDAAGNTVVYGGSSYHSNNYWTYVAYQLYGKNQYYEDSGLSRWGDPQMVKAMNYRYQADNVEKIWFPLSKYRANNLQTQMVYMTGEVVSAITPNMIRFIRDTKNYPADFVTYFAPWPVMEKGQTNYMSGVSPFSHAGITSGYSKANIDAIWAFLKFYSTYGSKYLIVAGHQSNWKGTQLGELVNLVFGNEENAKKLIDIESFGNVVVNYKNPAFYDDILTAYSKVNDFVNNYTLEIHNEKYTVEEGMRLMQRDCDAAIKAERGY